MHVAIIGAGVSGLACADILISAGHTVELFDKGEGAGGRVSTRRWQTPLGEVSVDHGAQYFTARDPAFKRLVDEWSDLGIAAPWPPAGDDAWVGVPGMNAVVKQMASAVPVFWNYLVNGLFLDREGWRLLGDQGESGPFDVVILAIPAEQAAAILALHDFTMMGVALRARSQPCWTGMFVFDRPLEGLPTLIRDRGGIAWATRNNAKPGRAEIESWVVQADAPWSTARLEDAPDLVADQLMSALLREAQSDLPRPVAATAHRWRYALSAGTGDGALWNDDLRLGVCGDWLLGPRIECAWLSGRLLAQRCLAPLPQSQSVAEVTG